MATPDDLDAYLYGLLHRGTRGDVAHYLDVCREAAHVLELGCGDGRIAVPLAAEGIRVTGIDRDPARLDAARRRAASDPRVPPGALTLVAGDMTSFDLEARFDRILIPFNGLYCLEDDDEVRECLLRVHAHLVPGGTLWLDVYPVEPSDAPPPGREPGPPTFLTEIVDGDRRVRVFESDRWQAEDQRIDVEYRFLIRDPSGAETRTQHIRHRYLTRDEIRAGLETAGFSAITVRSGFDGADRGGPWVVSATR